MWEVFVKLGIILQGFFFGGLSFWVDFGEFKDSCIVSLLKCLNGIVVSFKVSLLGNEIGYVFFLKGLVVFYRGIIMYFYV